MDYRRDFLTRSGRHHAAIEREGKPFLLNRDCFAKLVENEAKARARAKEFERGRSLQVLVVA